MYTNKQGILPIYFEGKWPVFHCSKSWPRSEKPEELMDMRKKEMGSG
jgi:hypothetical protein